MYKNLIIKSIKDIFDNSESIIKALVIPLILLIILNLASTAVTPADQRFSILGLFFIFLSLLVDIVILITVHRILILGNDSVPTWGIQKFEQREFTFFFRYLIVAIVFIVVVVLSTGFFQLLGINIFVSIFFTMLVCAIYLSRISLVFPAIAVDTKMTFKESFEYTKDFKLLIFVTVIAFPIFFSLVFGGIYTLIISVIASSLSADLNFLLVLLNVIVSVFLVSALSNTYIYISETLAQKYSNSDDYIEDDSYNEEDDTQDQNKDKE